MFYNDEVTRKALMIYKVLYEVADIRITQVFSRKILYNNGAEIRYK